MRNNHRPQTRVFSLLALFIALSLACSLPGAAAPTATATPPPPPTETRPPPTDAPTPVPPTATRTPLPPTATDTPTPVPPTATPDRTGTANAQASATAGAVVAIIEAELRKIDLSTETGHLGFVHKPFTIKVNTYMEQKLKTDYPDLVVSDFVLHSDMTWNSSSGLAGCAFLVRSEADFLKGKQYRVYMMRLSGLPLWDIEYYNLGRFQYNVTGQVLDTAYLDAGANAVNKITIVAEGEKFTVYANGEQMRVATDSKLKEGRVNFMAWQESGETTCKFDNTWLWVYK